VTENRVQEQDNGDTEDRGTGSETTIPTSPPIAVPPSEQGSESMALEQGTPDVTWVSLREANTLTGVSKSALRKWYRTGRIKSQTVEGKHGPEKRVILEEVREQAEHREIAPPPESSAPPATAPSEEEALPATLKLVEALTELAGKYAESEGARQRAEQKVEHLESRLREVRSEVESQRSASNQPSSGPPRAEEQWVDLDGTGKSGVLRRNIRERGRTWWRNRQGR